MKSVKLNQVGSEIAENKQMQVVDEIPFPPFFAFVPWRHHVLIIQKCEDVEEALEDAIERRMTSFLLELGNGWAFVGRQKEIIISGKIRKNSDNPTIGLLICRDLDRTEVQLSFQGITTPMGVATYDNIGTKDIIDQMPTQEQINRQIDLAEAEFRKRN